MRHFAVIAAGIFAILPARAEIVTYEFTGVINSVREVTNDAAHVEHRVESSAVVPGSVAVGDTFHGTFSYDTAMPVTYSDGSYARYDSDPGLPQFINWLALDKSGASISTQGQQTAIAINRAADSLYLGSGAQNTPYAAFIFHFSDSTGAVLENLSIPADVNINDFSRSSVDIIWSSATDNKYVILESMVTSFDRVSPVPEPSTYALLFAGLAIVGGAAARKRNRLLPLTDQSTA